MTDGPSTASTRGDGGSRAVERDPRVRDLVPPARLTWTSPGALAPEDPESLLESPLPGPGKAARRCLLKPGAAVLLDFGRELHGGVQVAVASTAGNRPARVRIRFGESASEAMADPFPVHGHAIHDHQALLPWYGTTEVGLTGFRFVRIDAIDQVGLAAVKAVHLHRDLPWRGSFRCSDPRLDRIWEVGAYTTQLCMQDLLWDGVKRDRLVWIGDMHPEAMVIATVFGACDIVPRSLDRQRDATPLPGWMNGISSYSVWWLLIQQAWWLHTGDRAYLAAQGAYLAGLCEQLLGCVGLDGAEALGEWRFLDWPSSNDPAAIRAGLQGLATLGLEAGAGLCDGLGRAELALRCRDGAARLRRHAPPASTSKQANALLALAGVRDAATVNREVLALEPLRGLSTFYGYYVLEARAKAGDHAGCLDVIRRYWGAMLDLGATTFWEDFNLDWTPNACGIDRLVPAGMKDIHGDFGDHCYKGFRHSLCHGWASGPTAWLSQHVLGIHPATPGFAQVHIRPELGNLEWAEGTFPTPHGDIRVRHDMSRTDKIQSDISLPEGVRLS